MQTATFTLWDYLIFGATLLLSALIGIYIGCSRSRQNSITDYLYGNGKMKAIPVGLSMYSSAVSAITIIGVPSEIYVFGSQFIIVALGSLISVLITRAFILPIFCGNMNIKMPYEYFELRFDTRVRSICSLMYVLHVLLYVPTVLYASTLSFSELTGYPLLGCSTVIGGICVLYTMIGGFKSVIWTDTFQATLMLASCLIILVISMEKLGGIEEVWITSEKGGRINFFDLNPDPFIRTTFWTALIGQAFTITCHSGCSASTLQRFMSLSSIKDGNISFIIGALGYGLTIVILGLTGLCMYASYYNNDPIKNKEIESANQLMPYFIADTIGKLPGFSGFFLAGLISAGLSTLSTELNTISGLIYHDLIRKIYKHPITDKQGAQIMKLIVLVIGIICLSAVPIFQNSKYIMQVTIMVGGITHGAKLGVIILGSALPKVNSEGAIWGIIVSLIISTWLTIGQYLSDVNTPYILPTSNINMTAEIFDYSNITTYAPHLLSIKYQEPFILYKLSYMYIPFVGTIICVLVGILVSYLTGNNKKKLDPRLLVSYVRSYIPTDISNATELSNCISHLDIVNKK